MKTLRLFGGVSITDPDGSPLPPGAGQRHRVALLALLAVETRGLSRDKLIAYLWPERDTRHARNLLNVSVYVLRSSLGEELVLSRGDDLRLNPGLITTDVGDFAAAMGREEYEAAVNFYEGPFLDGFFLAGSRDFELWADRQRERFAGMYVKALESLAGAAEARGDAPGAVEWWKRRMAHDRFDSRVTVRLMRALDMAGNRAGALEIANTHAELLREEFATESGPEVVALAEHLRSAPAAVRPPFATGNEQALIRRARQDEPTPLAQPSAAGLTRRRRFGTIGGVAVLAILALMAAGGIGWQTSSSSPGTSDPLEPALAVLPFEVIGTEVDLLSEDLVSLLSANLDGVDGLRIIDPQVVLSRWAPESKSAGEAGRSATIRKIGRVSGASHVLEGSLVGSAGLVRLTARIHGIGTGEDLGTFRVEGQADSILALVDRVSVEVLRMMLAEAPGRSRQPGLARVITPSLPALKAYLAGERAYRRLRWKEAVLHYNEAVELDSTFVLALYRLSFAHGWMNSSKLFREYSEQAVALSDRLSERERLLLEGQLQVAQSRAAAIETFRRLVSEYPGNVEGWYGLGEALWHLPGPWPADAPAKAFRRTLDLDPAYAPALIHLVEDAIVRGDAPATRELVARQDSIDSDSPAALGFRLAERLAFGDPETRARAAADVRTVPAPVLDGARRLVEDAPDQRAAFETLLEAEIALDPDAREALIYRLPREGRFAEAREIKDRFFSDWPWRDALWHLQGHDDPQGRDVARAVRNQAAEGTAISMWSRFLLGALAAQAAEWEAADSAVSVLLTTTWESGARADSVAAREARALGLLLRAYVELRRGAQAVPPELEAALTDLRPTGPRLIGRYTYDLVRFAAGRMLQQRGDLAAAGEQFEHIVDINYVGPPETEFYLAQVYEGLRDLDRAITNYDSFLRWTARADPEYGPLRREAREALRRLRGV